MLNDALEFLAKKWGNVVLYDQDGNPSFYVPFKKCLSSDLDASLPGHVHPAFVCGSTEYDRVLIGKYMAAELTANGTLYSIPGKAPRVNLGADPFLTRMRAFKTGASGLTIADHGLILLTAKKMGWTPKGNNNYGADYRDGTLWAVNTAVTVGAKKVFRGWEYECLVAHTTSADHYPDNDRTYWKKLTQVGGIPVPSTISASNPSGLTTLNGSGPISWCLGSDPANLVDIQGNAFEQVYGLRYVNCEIQILPNNDAALPTADLSASSTQWKAIKPSLTDATYTLVDPGTTGTLHWTWANSKLTLDTVVPEFDNQYRGTNFKDLARNTEHVPYVPSILQELGIFPISGDTTEGYYYVHMTASERFPRRGGDYDYTSGAGLGYLHSGRERSDALTYCGARPRFLET